MSCPRRYVVIKIDSHSLVDVQGHLDLPYLHEVATHCVLLWSEGFSPILVSSGAVTVGMSHAGLRMKPRDVHRCMALAAIGQMGLNAAWAEAFLRMGRLVSPIPLTHDDFRDLHRCHYLSTTIRNLLSYGAIPIISENPVYIPTIYQTVDDSDQLAALLAVQLQAEVLVLLSDVKGVYDKDPGNHKDATIMRSISHFSRGILGTAGEVDPVVRDKMRNKEDAVRRAVMGGTHVVIAHAREVGVVSRAVLYRGHVGTFIVGERRARSLSLSLREEGDGEEEDAMSPEERSLCTTSQEISLTFVTVLSPRN